MRLKKVALKNFRCFDSLELELHPRLTVIVGENGAGKTAILDALASALSPVVTQLSSANQRLIGRGIKDTDFRLVPWQGRGGKVRWGAADFAQVVAESSEGLIWDNWRPSVAGKEPPHKVGRSEVKKYIQQISDTYKTKNPALTPVFAYYGARRGYIDVPERLRGAKENYDHPATALIGALNSLSDFREMLAWFDQEEASELRANKGVSSNDFEDSLALTAVRAAVIKLLGKSFRTPHFNKEHKFVVIREADGAPMFVNQLSQGYQSMLALAMDFSRRLAIANSHLAYGDDFAHQVILDEIAKLEKISPDLPPIPKSLFQDALAMSAPAIMLVDEIDLHLHPAWQQRILDDLMDTFPLTQFIVTTHSPQVLTTVPAECIRILKDGQVFASPPGTEGAEPARLLKQVLGLKDVRPPNNQATKELREYLALVDRNEWNSPRALELRRALDERYQGNEPQLLEADLQIDNLKWEMGQ
jgi:predicted ATP-binding protein involved in virulence